MLDTLEEFFRGQVSGIGTTPKLVAAGETYDLPASTGFEEGLALLLDWLDDKGLNPTSLAGFGHRIVHGGSHFVQPLRVGDKELEELEKLRSLAPLHLPFGLSVLRITRQTCARTCRTLPVSTRPFHATQPELATRLPLPRSYFDKGYRRYGFHGLNYEHVVDELPRITGQAPAPPRHCSALGVWRFHVRHSRWQKRCHHHGLFDGRWLGYGHAHGLD